MSDSSAIGELEETVLKTFCTSAHLRNVLDRPDGPLGPGSSQTIFQESLKILQKCMPDVLKGTMLEMSGGTELEESTGPGLKSLDQDVVESFVEGDLRGVSVLVLNRIRRDGRVFAPRRASRPHSNVFFQPKDETTLRPGTIREIFQYSGTVYLVIQCYVQKHSGTYFDRCSDFGAEVWSQVLCDHPVVIPLSSSVYPGYLREWDQDKFVLKPLIPVRPITFNTTRRMRTDAASKPTRTYDFHTHLCYVCLNFLLALPVRPWSPSIELPRRTQAQVSARDCALRASTPRKVPSEIPAEEAI